MVSLNLTLFIEFGLFVLFLWVANVLIFRPVLRVMDAREAKIKKDESVARAVGEEAQALETRRAAEFAAVRRAASEKVDEARWAALEEFSRKIADRRRRADEEVAAAREEALKQVEAERERCPALVPELAETIAERLGVGRYI